MLTLLLSALTLFAQIPSHGTFPGEQPVMISTDPAR